MNGIFRFLMILPVFLVLSAWPAKAQTPPTIVEFWTKADTLFLEVTLNAEMFVAGIDPEARPDFADDARYRELRRRVSSELEPEVRSFVQDWARTLRVEVAGPARLSYEGVRIPIVGDTDTPRLSKLLLAAPLPEAASSLRLTWPEGHGPAVVKQQRVDAPYTGYLVAGEVSPLIPLQGGAALGPQQVLQVFLPKGLTRILPHGYHEIALVLSLVFLTLSLRPLLAQMLFVSLGLIFGLALSVYGAVALPSAVASQALTAATLVLALWNLVLRRLTVFRLLAVFGAGLLCGITLSTSLATIGVPPDHLPPAIFGYAGGVLVALYAIAAAVFAVSALIAGASERMRGRISVLASILIAGIAVYWLAEPLILS